MDTIRNYLDNLFAALPRNEQTARLYSDLLATMEDKYRELKAAGRSENEAIGIVISEFGNIEELLEELDISPADEQAQSAPEPGLPVLDTAEADAFLEYRWQSGILIGSGVLCCILAPGMFLLLSALVRWSEAPGFVALAVLVAIGVSLFIYSGSRGERFQYIREQPFALGPDASRLVSEQQQNFQPTYLRLLITGIALCILSPVGILAFANARWPLAEELSMLSLFVVAGLGVFLIVLAGNMKGGFQQLLQTGDYKPVQKKNRQGKLIGAIAAIWWPLTTCIYLLYSFFTFQWHFSWIIWPVSAILFGGVSGLCAILGEEDGEDD